MGARLLWAVTVLLLVWLSVGCGAKRVQTSVPLAVRQERVIVGLSFRNSDLVCAQTVGNGQAFCRTVGEFRLWLAERKAAP